MGCCNSNSDTNKMESFDLNQFKSHGTNCFGKNHKDPPIQNCDYLNRLINGLKYYTLTTKNENGLSNDIFMNFIQVYDQVINDYHHFINVHDNDLEIIHNQLVNDKNWGECLLDKCLLFKRHFNRNRRTNELYNSDEKEALDAKVIFY
eukprot:481853_1